MRKVLTLIIVLMLSAPPLQAGMCMMDMGKTDHQHMSQADDGCTCCNPDPSGHDSNCGGADHCGACSVGVSVPPSFLPIQTAWNPIIIPALASSAVLPSHSSPPFRPPIS